MNPQHLPPSQYAMVGFNLAIALAYVFNGVYFARRFPIRLGLARWTLMAQTCAAVFFFTCAGTHLALASHIYHENTHKWWFHWDMLLNHGLQAAAGFGFAFIAWRKLDLALIAQKSDRTDDLEAWHKAVMDGSISAIIVICPQGIIHDWNHTAERIFLYSKEEAVGQSVFDLIVPDDQRDEMRNNLDTFLDGYNDDRDYVRERKCCTKAKNQIHVEFGARRFHMTVGDRVVLYLRDVTRRVEAETGRRRALAKLLHAEMMERQAVAEELHDDTIQVMSGTLLKLDTCELRLRQLRDCCDGEEEQFDDFGAMLVSSITSLREAVRRTRRMMFELRPPALVNDGLGPAIASLAREVDREAGCKTVVSIGVGRYANVIEELAYRTILEALTNVRKHARATHVQVTVLAQSGGIHGVITDNGKGFDTSRETGDEHLHLGLDSSKERVKLAGGRYFIVSEPGKGTTVSFDLPTHNGYSGLSWSSLYEMVGVTE